MALSEQGLYKYNEKSTAKILQICKHVIFRIVDKYIDKVVYLIMIWN